MIEFNKEKFDNICENITILGESVVTAQLAYSKQVATLDFFESTMFTDLIQQYSKAGEPYTETKLKHIVHSTKQYLNLVTECLNLKHGLDMYKSSLEATKTERDLIISYLKSMEIQKWLNQKIN